MDQRVKNTDITNWLKAIAILAVCVNHFIIIYTPRAFGIYANGIISFFFLFSGFGIFHSLNKTSHLPIKEFLLLHFKKRLIRIYPLFWIWCLINGFENGLLGFFALDFINPKSPWFVPAIMQCYIMAPFLFLLVKKTTTTMNFALVTGLTIVLNLFLIGYLNIESMRAVGYREIFLLHIYVFYFGYILAIKQEKFISNKFLLLTFSILACFFIQGTTSQTLIDFPGRSYLFAFSMVFAIFFTSGLMFTSVQRLPFSSCMNFIGEHTYSIYLFHGLGNFLLHKAGIIHHDNTGFLGIIVWSVTLPFFILVYAALETFVNELAIKRRSPAKAINIYYNKLPFRKAII